MILFFFFFFLDIIRLIKILNKCHQHKGFVYKKSNFVPNNEIEVEVIPRKNSKGKCPNCKTLCPGYDKLPERRFEFIPFWGFLVFLIYARRRVSCIDCGVIAEEIPWAIGKNHSNRFSIFWEKRERPCLSISAQICGNRI
ncbi:MAG: hypothetical protein GY936_07975 [Ignavibacteriae bacterium]|nr:hypothetical protein [Ignavibacteriota bacterium]